MSWPTVRDEAEYEAIRRDDAAFRPGLDAILRRHGLVDEPQRFSSGSLPVWGVGSRVVKAFPAYDRELYDNEVRALAFLDGRLPLPAPRLEATGAQGDWTYVVMERVPGVPLDGVWGTLPPGTRRDLATQLGEGLAALHTLPVEGLPDAWEAFVAAQIGGCGDRQRKRKLDEPWASQVDGFLARNPPRRASRSLLHTEVMPAHVFALERDGRWRLTGWLDFEPSMVGDPEYELASIGVFVSAGDPAVLGAVLSGWGRTADPGLPTRAMVWALLHRYSRLRWYLDRIPPQPGVTTLEALAAQWFAT